MTAPTPSPIGTWQAVQFLAGPDTPPENVVHDGKVFAIDPQFMTAVGSGPGNPGVLLGIRGYLQDGGPAGKQWVMVGLITAGMRAQFDAIPTNGWVNATARQRYINVGQQLLAAPYNMPGPDVINLLQVLYRQAVVNDRAVPPGG